MLFTDGVSVALARLFVTKATSEMQARLARKDNVAFYNVNEPTGNLKSETMRQEKDAVIEICNDMGVRLYDGDILSIKRLGQKNKKTQGVRRRNSGFKNSDSNKVGQITLNMSNMKSNHTFISGMS